MRFLKPMELIMFVCFAQREEDPASEARRAIGTECEQGRLDAARPGRLQHLEARPTHSFPGWTHRHQSAATSAAALPSGRGAPLHSLEGVQDLVPRVDTATTSAEEFVRRFEQPGIPLRPGTHPVALPACLRCRGQAHPSASSQAPPPRRRPAPRPAGRRRSAAGRMSGRGRACALGSRTTSSRLAPTTTATRCG